MADGNFTPSRASRAPLHIVCAGHRPAAAPVPFPRLLGGIAMWAIGIIALVKVLLPIVNHLAGGH